MTAVEVFIDAAGAPRLVGQARVARARDLSAFRMRLRPQRSGALSAKARTRPS